MKKSLVYTLALSLLAFSNLAQADRHGYHSKSDCMKKDHHSSEQMFKQLDTNEDGMISLEEFETNHQNIKSLHKKKRYKKQKDY